MKNKTVNENDFISFKLFVYALLSLLLSYTSDTNERFWRVLFIIFIIASIIFELGLIAGRIGEFLDKRHNK